MKILIIGNGFDLAHDLPTRYKDFLDFVKLVNSKWDILSKEARTNTYNLVKSNRNTLADDGTVNNCSEKIKAFVNNLFEYIKNDPNNTHKLNVYRLSKDYTFKRIFNKLSEENKQKIDFIKRIVDQNFWIELFIGISEKYKNENWSDFETIISLVIQQIDYFRKHKNVTDGKEFLDYNLKSLSSIILDIKLSSYPYSIKEIADCKNNKQINKLEKDLKELIKNLELYLEKVTNKEYIEKIKFFENLNIDKIISFNYTDTYKNLYDVNASTDLKENYCFIHGKIQNNEESNIVLGIDDYLEGEDVNLDLSFIRFKKYYQRIYKETDCNYKDWLKGKEEKEVHIYGHSLDISDKDILKEIIETEHTNTIIYYYTKSAYDQQIINLIKILGKENLLKRVYDKNIKFLSTNSTK